jgi:hypothetical protein
LEGLRLVRRWNFFGRTAERNPVNMEHLDAEEIAGIPFGFAQGRLSTAPADS